MNGETSGWKFFDNTKELLEHIAKEYGSDALYGLRFYLDHIASSMPKAQIELMKQPFECGALKILQDNTAAMRCLAENTSLTILIH